MQINHYEVLNNEFENIIECTGFLQDICFELEDTLSDNSYYNSLFEKQLSHVSFESAVNTLPELPKGFYYELTPLGFMAVSANENELIEAVGFDPTDKYCDLFHWERENGGL
jgi:hypothetical protein